MMIMTIEEHQPLVENGQDHEEMKTNRARVHVDVNSEEHVDGDVREDRKEDERTAGQDDEHCERANNCEEEEEEEETLVVLELCDFKNHPLFDDYSSATLEGIDTATPMLRIGEYILHGKLEETVGTSYFYDTDTTGVADKTYRFAGQTIKKIKFTITPPEEF